MFSQYLPFSRPRQVTELLIFPADVSLDTQESPKGPPSPSELPQPLTNLTMKVGDTLILTVAARLADGELIPINVANAPWNLRLRSDDYSVFVGSCKPFALTARQISERKVKITAACLTGEKRWGRLSKLKAYLEITVVPGQRFVAFTERPLPGSALALWRFGRRLLRISWLQRSRSYQYLMAGDSLEMAAQQHLDKVGWACCDSLASGWQPQKITSVTCLPQRHIVCGEPDERGLFSLSASAGHRKPVSLEVRTADGEMHRLSLKILPAATEETWRGLEESPPFKSRARMRWENFGRGVGLACCSLFASVWLIGCCLAQVHSRGLWSGIGYTLAMLGLGISAVIGITVVMLLTSVLFFTILRKFKI